MEPQKLQITERELAEIKLALFYSAFCNHGTAGHNRLVLLAKFAIERGFGADFAPEGVYVTVPDDVEVIPQ